MLVPRIFKGFTTAYNVRGPNMALARRIQCQQLTGWSGKREVGIVEACDKITANTRYLLYL